MPLYEYACRDCGHHFDVRQGFTEAPLTDCPRCSGSIRRVIQPVGIVFKGSGFYKTDSRSTSEASVAAGERKTTSPAPGTDGGTTAPSTGGNTAAAKPAASEGSPS